MAGAAKPVEEKDLAAYLFVYFKDDTHSPYFAVSRDGYSFTDVNQAKPILMGSDLAEQKGIRDPHIMRGPDGAFYMVMTDLHLFGQRAGYRTTQWERPAELRDWGNNRAIVMMKSNDLITWTHLRLSHRQGICRDERGGLHLPPETIYDMQQNKVDDGLFHIGALGHSRKDRDCIYSYADDAFTKLETVPQELFKYPRNSTPDSGCGHH